MNMFLIFLYNVQIIKSYIQHICVYKIHGFLCPYFKQTNHNFFFDDIISYCMKNEIEKEKIDKNYLKQHREILDRQLSSAHVI